MDCSFQHSSRYRFCLSVCSWLVTGCTGTYISSLFSTSLYLSNQQLFQLDPAYGQSENCTTKATAEATKATKCRIRKRIECTTKDRIKSKFIVHNVRFVFNQSIQPARGFACIVIAVILFSTSGLYVLGFTGSFSNSSIASKPSITRPNNVYLRSKCGCAAYVMKNWLAFVLGPLKRKVK